MCGNGVTRLREIDLINQQRIHPGPVSRQKPGATLPMTNHLPIILRQQGEGGSSFLGVPKGLGNALPRGVALFSKVKKPKILPKGDQLIVNVTILMPKLIPTLVIGYNRRGGDIREHL